MGSDAAERRFPEPGGERTDQIRPGSSGAGGGVSPVIPLDGWAPDIGGAPLAGQGRGMALPADRLMAALVERRRGLQGEINRLKRLATAPGADLAQLAKNAEKVFETEVENRFRAASAHLAELAAQEPSAALDRRAAECFPPEPADLLQEYRSLARRLQGLEARRPLFLAVYAESRRRLETQLEAMQRKKAPKTAEAPPVNEEMPVPKPPAPPPSPPREPRPEVARAEPAVPVDLTPARAGKALEDSPAPMGMAASPPPVSPVVAVPPQETAETKFKPSPVAARESAPATADEGAEADMTGGPPVSLGPASGKPHDQLVEALDERARAFPAKLEKYGRLNNLSVLELTSAARSIERDFANEIEERARLVRDHLLRLADQIGQEPVDSVAINLKRLAHDRLPLVPNDLLNEFRTLARRVPGLDPRRPAFAATCAEARRHLDQEIDVRLAISAKTPAPAAPSPPAAAEQEIASRPEPAPAAVPEVTETTPIPSVEAEPIPEAQASSAGEEIAAFAEAPSVEPVKTAANPSAVPPRLEVEPEEPAPAAGSQEPPSALAPARLERTRPAGSSTRAGIVAPARTGKRAERERLSEALARLRTELEDWEEVGEFPAGEILILVEEARLDLRREQVNQFRLAVLGLGISALLKQTQMLGPIYLEILEGLSALEIRLP